MKRFVVVCFLVIAGAVPASAQSGGHIGLYSDPEGECCVLNETLYVTNYVYAVHTPASGALGVQFKVVNAWIGPIVGPVTLTGFVIGDIYEGVIVAYSGCVQTSHLVATMSFIPPYASATESTPLWVEADPTATSGQIEVLDCESNVLYATGGELNVNFYDYIPLGCEGCFTTAAEESTWGKVKALYR